MKENAAQLLAAWKGENYAFGLGRLSKLGGYTAESGAKAAVVASGMGRPWGAPLHERVEKALQDAGVQIVGGLIRGPRPNAPLEDVFRIAEELKDRKADVIAAVGGGSLIDAVKAAAVYALPGEKHADLEGYFGVGRVSAMLEEAGLAMPPMVAVQIASGSAAHLTKYSNITDLETSQKMLIVDAAIVPPKAVFDYETTVTMSREFTMDGALDGVAHCLEVFYGASGETFEKVKPVALQGIELIVGNLRAACDSGSDLEAREALGLGTDLGGYSIMIGGTNGGHLTSFSLVDVLSHGRACALMNPYYTVFFAPAIEDRLRDVGAIYRTCGYADADIERLSGRDLGVAVAQAMIAQSTDLGFPTRLSEVDGFTDAHIQRALTAAKNPKLEMKLKNMPVPLSAETVDEYMGSVLDAARKGDFSLVKNMARKS
jgi:alcohol dehydrogenase class IV